MDRVDSELKRPAPLSAASRSRMLAALKTELPNAPKPGRWRREIAMVIASVLGVASIFGAVLVGTGNASLADIAGHWVPIALSVVMCGFASMAALMPRGLLAQRVSLAAFVLSAIALVLLRREGSVGATPEWVCTATHVGAGVFPLVIGLLALRRGGANFFSSLAIGVAAGATGAIIGELACARDATHVLIFHVPAWAAMVVAGAVFSRIIPPRSHAP